MMLHRKVQVYVAGYRHIASCGLHVRVQDDRGSTRKWAPPASGWRGSAIPGAVAPAFIVGGPTSGTDFVIVLFMWWVFGFHASSLPSPPDEQLSSSTCDSAETTEGDLFVAGPRFSSDSSLDICSCIGSSGMVFELDTLSTAGALPFCF